MADREGQQVDTLPGQMYLWTGSAPVRAKGNAAGELLQSTPGTIIDGSKTVASAGSREALGSTTAIKYCIITAKETNVGTIWVGGSTVAAGRGRPLVSLQAERIDIDDLAKIYIDASNSGDGITYVAVA
jgi:hypothetical protein